MLFIISDTNIFIDMEKGEILQQFFHLPFHICCPYSVFQEELSKQHGDLPRLGLKLLDIKPEFIEKIFYFKNLYGEKISINDYTVLSLAIQESAPLVTGDSRLRSAAEQENVLVCGTIALVCIMVYCKLLLLDDAKAAFEKMRSEKRKLPWNIAFKALDKIAQNPPIIDSNLQKIITYLNL